MLRVWCAVWLLVQPASAETSNGHDVQVTVNLVAQAYSPEFAELLHEWLRLQHLDAQIHPQPRLALDHLLTGDDSSSVRVWVTLRTSEQARLYFADPRGSRFHLRDVPLDHALDELGREKVAQVVLASVLAFVDRSLPETPLESVKRALTEAPLAADTEAAVTASSAAAETDSTPADASPASAAIAEPAAAPPTQPPGPREPAPWWALAARYHVLYRGPEGWGHGPGLGFELWPILQGFGLGFVVDGRYEWPHSETSADLALTLQTTALRTAVVLASVVADRPRWTLSLGAGWDWYRFEPESTTQDLSVSGDETGSRAVACSAIGIAVPFGKLHLDLSFGVEVPLAKTHYDILVAGVEEPVITPWPVQPHASLGLVWQ